MNRDAVVRACEELLNAARALPSSGVAKAAIKAALDRFDLAEAELNSAMGDYLRSVRPK